MRHLLNPDKYRDAPEVYDNPALLLEDAQYCLEAVAFLFERGQAPELTAEQSIGFSIIMHSVAKAMEASRSQILDLTLQLDRVSSPTPTQPAPRATEYPRVDPAPADAEDVPEARAPRARRRV